MSSWISWYKFKSIKHFTLSCDRNNATTRYSICSFSLSHCHEIKFIEKKRLLRIKRGRNNTCQPSLSAQLMIFSHAILDDRETSSTLWESIWLFNLSQFFNALLYDIEKGSQIYRAEWFSLLLWQNILFKRFFCRLWIMMTHRIKNVKI